MRLLKLTIINIILILASGTCITAFADAREDTSPSNELQTQEWANSIASLHQAQSMDHLKEMMQMEGFDKDLRESILKPRPVLQIFVSSSMSKQLLKAYAKEASRYGGVLVFRGLPQGSFRRLTELVMEISGNDKAAMQIDDEAFRAFGIKSVPAIVLSKPASMFDQQTGVDKFDKIYGNITIKAALELFSSSGDLQIMARGLLGK